MPATAAEGGISNKEQGISNYEVERIFNAKLSMFIRGNVKCKSENVKSRSLEI